MEIGLLVIVIVMFIVENTLLAIKYRHKVKQIWRKFYPNKSRCSIPPFEDEENGWYTADKPILILHGVGRYNNSQEGIERGISEGYKIIEIDVGITSDNVFVLTHRFEPDDEIIFENKPSLDEFLNQGAAVGETPLTLEQFTDTYCQNMDNGIYYIVDCAHGIELDVAQWLSKNVNDNSREKLIFQVHTIKLLEKVYEMKAFVHIHYNGSANEISQILPKLYKRNVLTCSISDREINKSNHDLEFIVKSGLHVFAYTVNHKRRLSHDLELGVMGVFTDSLLPEK